MHFFSLVFFFFFFLFRSSHVYKNSLENVCVLQFENDYHHTTMILHKGLS